MPWIRFLTLMLLVYPFIVTGICLADNDSTAHGANSLSIGYPKNKTLFPGNIVSPNIRWKDQSESREWRIEIRGDDDRVLASAKSSDFQWRPSFDDWNRLKDGHHEETLTLSITGFPEPGSTEPLSRGSVQFTISSLTITSPIFYRQVPLPARYARSRLASIEWRLGSVASSEPRTVLSGMNVCGNCHSFSSDGHVLGMDVDFGSDKGAYVITEIEAYALFDKSKVMTWSDYNPQSKQPTFGLLSRVSPCGRYVISTVNDYAVFRYLDDLDCSQMFFPVRGVLVVYDREGKTFHALPGASNPLYVQTNAEFSPDGKSILFARAPAIEDSALHAMIHPFITGAATYQYDLYRLPFPNEKNASPEPLSGASQNGMSNFFPKFSPDGKWIVFCKADRFMLNQLDSELYIIPATGGTARRLECNFAGRMNSWHSWSPDSKWLVFSSKANGPYTQLWITHITDEGESTPPVLLEHLTDDEVAANIPEFVNISFQEQLLSIVNRLD